MADDGSRSDRTRLSATEVQMMALLVIIGLTVGLLGGALTFPHYPEIAKLFWGAAITLMFGALLGGVVKLLFEDFDRRRAQRAAQMDFISRVLGDLKNVYDAVDRAKTLITARRSAKTSRAFAATSTASATPARSAALPTRRAALVATSSSANSSS